MANDAAWKSSVGELSYSWRKHASIVSQPIAEKLDVSRQPDTTQLRYWRPAGWSLPGVRYQMRFPLNGENSAVIILLRQGNVAGISRSQ